MRRDERPFDPAEGDSEIEAIEAQWTKLWESEGGPKGRVDSIRRRPELQIMRPYIAALPKGSRLLDGGCGMGDWVLLFTREGYPTLGLDVSKITVAKLNEMFPDMEFAVGDIRSTGLPDSSIDAYFSWGTFEHFEEGFERVVQEAYRIVKPGGLLFVSVPFDNFRIALRNTFGRPRNLPPRQIPTRFYQWRLTRGELALILRRHGFAIEDVKIIHKREGIRRWLEERFGIRRYSVLSNSFVLCLSPLSPAWLVGHMILAVARKPLSDG